MGLLHRSGACALALAAAAVGLQLEPVVLRDLSFGAPGGSVTVGAVRAPLWSAALAQTPQAFTLENVAFSFGSTKVQASTVAFSGVTTPRAEIEALFSAASAEPLATRLSRIDAAQVTIPELKVQQTVAGTNESAIYRNVVLSNIRQGRVAEATASATGTLITRGTDQTAVSYGRLSIADFDAPALARIYEAKEASPGPLARIYGRFSIDDLDFVDGRSGAKGRIAHLGGRDFMARGTRDSWAGTMAILTELADKEKPTEEEKNRLRAAILDILTAFDIGLVEATGIEMKVRPEDGKGEAVSTIRRMAYASAKGAEPADARMEGMEFRREDGRIGIETIAFTGFSFASTFETLKGIGDRPLKEIDASTLRGLAPKLGTMRIAGITIDIPSDKTKANGFDRVKASLKAFEVAAGEPMNAIPTVLRIDLQNLAVPLPENSADEGIRTLTGMGYRSLDLSMGFAARWSETAQELALQDVSVQGQDMGRIALTGTLGNVGKDVFNPDTALATVALIGARARELRLTVENGGLFDRYLAQAAKEQKTTPEALRRTYAAGAAMVVPTVLGSSEQAKVLSQAISRFIAKPGRITVTARAKDPAGLGVADIVAAPEPAAVVERLDIAASAE
ncbi:hypothetical protein [Microvirga thermotolerans]|uniref:Uncharacterized protein n=1 Tax=Microvirga thermotolerans TaxID=2651334 RepID=A0A5P9JV15_9HYPH|nr:hypothetical protein [Microvirga thermotolerans]QFU16273.1 hypothetical protein GDR74_08590 [Microvirga thermotolerans]